MKTETIKRLVELNVVSSCGWALWFCEEDYTVEYILYLRYSHLQVIVGNAAIKYASHFMLDRTNNFLKNKNEKAETIY